MSIRLRVLLVLFAIFSLYGIADLAIRSNLVWPSFNAWEQHTALAASKRFHHRIELELNYLDKLAYDWSAWDETYALVEGRNAAYRSNHLPDSVLQENDLDLMAFYDRDGQQVLLLQGGKWGTELLQQLAPPTLSSIHRLQHFDPQRPLAEQRSNGILITTQGPWMLAARPILHNGSIGPTGGVLVMGRRLDQQRVDQYGSELGSELRLQWQRSAPPIEGSGFAHLTDDVQFRPHDGPEQQRYCATLTMVAADGQASLKLNALIDRSMTAQSFNLARTAWLAAALIGSAMLLLLTWLLNRHLVKPIQDLSALMQRVVDQGDYSLRPDLKRNDEIGQLARVFDELLNRIEEQNAVRELKSQHLQKLAGTDALTGIGNRRALEEYLDSSWQQSHRQQQPMAVILCDIDHFKQYNDHYGHLEGDNCLREVARQMRSLIQRQPDRVFRYGGEEFAVVLPGAELDGAMQLAEKLRQTLYRSHIPHATAPCGRVTLSLGVAAATGGQAASRLLLDAADRALYNAKREGRNRCHCSAPLGVASNHADATVGAEKHG